MSDTKLLPRVVPSGKVYRQIFDAEVQLVKSIENSQLKRESREASAHQADGSIPVVHLSRDVTGMGILDKRQVTWAEGFSNDPYTENPVVYKELTQMIAEEMQEAESNIASREVRGLPDVLVPSKTGSNIIERIADSRRERHECAVEDMHQELGVISTELEPRIVESGGMLMGRLAENDQALEALMSRTQRDDDLLAFSKKALYKLWEEVAAQSTVRQAWIQELDDTLQRIESDRLDMVREVFSNYTSRMESIAHIMQPDLQRLMDKESQMINQTVLSNKRAYGDLYSRLMMFDIEREKRQHSVWVKRVDNWKNLNTELTVEKFRDFMQSDGIVKPPNIEQTLQCMLKEQEQLNRKRLNVIGSLRDLAPPTSTKTAIYQWNQKVLEMSKQLDTLNQDYLNKLYKDYEGVCQQCLAEVERVKAHLVSQGICSEQRAQHVINTQCLPLVGQRQTAFEEILEGMDKSLEDQNKHFLTEMKSLFKYAQGAAHVWDVHEIGLAKQERNLQEKLEFCRQKHDNENQEREANCDILMDRMRQDSSEKALQDSLRKVLDIMEQIKTGYEVFHRRQFDIVQQYQGMVAGELKEYDDAICKFFAVDRTQPEEDTEKKFPEQQYPRKSKARSTSRSSSRSSEVDQIVSKAVSEVLATSKGSMFYVLREAGEHGVPPDDASSAGTGAGTETETETRAFLTETRIQPAEEGKETPDYIKTIEVNTSELIEVKKAIRLNFLNHLEDWNEEAVERANNVVAAKCEELNSELDLRLHLHQPRTKRAEMDVHNVRAAELVLHSERVSRHCKGVLQSIADLKQEFQQLNEEHNMLVDKFRNDIEALESVFNDATKSAKLVALQNQLQDELEQFMTVIRASLRQFRQHLDGTLQMLRESNARFIKSFKVFSDGGNFCPEEIEEYRKRLEKMSHRVDSAEGFIMADLEGMESKRLDQATRIASEFEDRFKNHMFDLIFMEKIGRWLTNTQVKIKAEVAESNSQAQRLAQQLNQLARRIDACEKPNLDKEEISPTQLNDGLKAVFEAFRMRAEYLNCIKEQQARPPSGTVTQGQAPPGVKVGFSSDLTPGSKTGGKQALDDPSLSLIKGIMSTQSTKTHAGPEADEAEAESKGHQKGHTGQGHQESRSDKAKVKGARASNQSAMVLEKNKPGGYRRGTTSAQGNNPPVRGQSATMKVIKIDKKLISFGEEQEGEERHLLGRISLVLRETLEGLLSAAELYYRQKGGRPVTRPQALQETYEQCVETVIHKLESYYKQSDGYHNQCLQELRAQLAGLEEQVSHVPPLVLHQIVTQHIRTAHAASKQIHLAFERVGEDLEKKKHQHKNELRPSLGHPHQTAKLNALCNGEEQRHLEFVQGVDSHVKTLQESAASHAQLFLEQLTDSASQLLLQFDDLLTVDDVLRGRVDGRKFATSELMRRKNAGLSLEEEQDKDKLPRGKNTWSGVPVSELVVMVEEKKEAVEVEEGVEEVRKTPGSRRRKKRPEKKEVDTLTASVTTSKTTLGHSATVEARDIGYKDYKKQFHKSLEVITEEGRQRLVAENRWMESWQTSVHKVKQLY